MKVRTQSKLSRYKLPLILLGTLVVLIGVYFLLRAVLPGESVDPVTPPRYDPIPGEYQLANNAYDRIEFDNYPLLLIEVDTGSERFALTRGLDSRFGKQTLFSYWSDYNDPESETAYLPNGFFIDYSYDNLYAGVAMGEYYTYPKYYSLLASLAFPGFAERIALSDDPVTYAAQIDSYGLGTSAAKVTIAGRTAAGKTIQRTIRVGKKLLSGKGYYFTVDDRPYVYASSTTAFSYLFTSPTEYISPRLVAAGLAQDGTSAPYQLRDFRTYKNKYVDTVGETVPTSAKVTLRETMRLPSPNAADGYFPSGVTSTVSYDLDTLRTSQISRRLASVLAGAVVGDQATPLTFTEITTLSEAGTSVNNMYLDLSDATAAPKTYRYTIKAVESAMDQDVEWTSGTAGDGAVYVKIVYTLAIDGVAETVSYDRRALIALDCPALTDDQRTALRGATLGADLVSPMTVEVTYTKETANKKTVKMYLSSIYFVEDAAGNNLPAVSSDAAYVALRYYTVNAFGEKSAAETIGYDLRTDTLGIASALAGLPVGEGQGELLYTYAEYYQITEAFRERQITAIDSFTVGELKVAFGYQEYSKRDPFFGESYFQNKLPSTDKNSVYGMNVDICQDLVSILGGIGSSSTSASGYVGLKTIAVGLTPERMKQYGLYANTVHFTLPRGIYDLDIEGNDEQDVPDMGYLTENEFIFYVSDPFVDPDDGKTYRYVGSEMYDLVVLVDAFDFVYLDYEFEEFFARRTLMSTAVTGIESYRVELNMEDVYGDFLFHLTQVKFEEGTAAEYIKTHVAMTPNGPHSFPLIDEFLPKTGDAAGSMNLFYNYATNGALTTSKNDYAGDGFFKDALTTVYLTSLEGLLTEEEKTAFAAGDPVMRITVKLYGDTLSHVFEFYRGSDRKVMVRMYTLNDAGIKASPDAEDFYITTFAFKKIVNAYSSLLSAKEVTYDNGYGDALLGK